MNKKLRAACYERSQGSCENCGKWAGEALHADHFFSRRNGESLETVWMLDPICDYAKTMNYPDRATWLERFIRHCQRHGYTEAAAKAIVALHTSTTKAQLRQKFGFPKEQP